MRRESVLHTFTVASLLCLVCSVLVSAAAVGLRDRQRANQERQRKLNILSAAGLSDEAERLGIESAYAQRIVARLVDLETGRFESERDVAGYDPRRAARDLTASVEVPASLDGARLGRRERLSIVYLVTDDLGQVDQIVVPIRGYGLWSTLWGFLSLDAESIRQGPAAITIRGLTYYEHAETPGLGGEVDNPRWKEKWREGKQIYDADWNVALRVVKGEVAAADAEAAYKVDGLSGATITANGVTNMIEYWFGEHGFRAFLQNLYRQPELVAQGGNDG